MADEATKQFAEEQLDAAESLAGEKEELYKRIAANRDMLRNLATQKKLTKAQEAEVIKFYPPKARKDSEADNAPATPAAA